ncbi:MAG: alpha/beta hydrolase, partial [Campylobacterota bacterium]|nr:alpha/beta hydrolase [Campylobacterota bacterium]
RDDYYIVTFDLPGFGKSAKSNQLYSISKYTKAINNIVNMYINKPFHLVGHSMGGAISLKYASSYQDRLKSLVLIDVAGVLTKTSYTKFLANSKIKDFFGIDIIGLRFRDMLSSIPEKIESIIPIDINSLLGFSKVREVVFRSNPTTVSAISLVHEDFSNIPQSIDINTRIIWGEDDDVAPLRTGYVLNKLIKNSKLDIIKGSKHLPIVDSFEIYIKYLKAHLNNPKYNTVVKKDFNISKKIILRNINNRVISGEIVNLELINCKNILIKDATIDKFTIVKTKVTIENTDINIIDSSYLINSYLEITASNINAKKGIDIYNSKLDFAGVYLSSNSYFFKNLNSILSQKIIFSLSRINNKTIHGDFKLKRDSTTLVKQQ